MRMISSHMRTTRAFTVLELTVSLAALLIISLGLIAILTSVGETVTGGRRLSRLNTTAQLVENQVRKDLAAITTSGFLLIRQQYADVNGNGRFDNPANALVNDSVDRVPLAENDQLGRARRVDEILFFSTGSFESKTSPADANLAPFNSTEARIYIGMGQRRREDFSNNSTYLAPRPSDDMATAETDRLGRDNPGNPNRYASSWMLLRHVALLSKPRDIERQTFMNAPIFGVDPRTAGGQRRLADGRFQIAMQPAAPSIFRSVSRSYPRPINAEVLRLPVAGDTDPNGISLASGVVDIVAADLLELRTYPYLFASGAGVLPDELVEDEIPVPTYEPLEWRPSPDVATRPTSPEPIDLIQAWYADAWPTESDPTVRAPYWTAGEPRGVRMRCEPSSPDLLSVISRQPTSDAQQLDMHQQTSNQRMLQSSNFLQGCTEFLIEWSFGELDSFGRQRWYGLTRYAGDTNRDGTVDRADWTIARPYGVDDTNDPNWGLIAEPILARKIPLDGVPLDETEPEFATFPHVIRPRLIHGVTPDANGRDVVLTSYFGDLDPTYSRDSFRQTLPTDVKWYWEPQPQQVRWIWPTQLRFTVSITDPEKPTEEGTFQFVVTLPERDRNSLN